MSVTKGAIIITISLLIARALSLFFIFPFSKIVGPEGLSLYSISYIPFVLFLDFTTLGIPQAVTKITSNYKNDNLKTYKVLKTGFVIILFLALLSVLIINVFSKQYLNISFPNQDNSDELLALRIISISLLFTPFVFLLRGYLQGHKLMYPSAISQIIEQIIRVGLILLSCVIVMKYNKDYKLAVYMALISTSISSVISLFFLFKRYKKIGIKKEKGYIYRELIKTSIPYLLLGISLNSYNFIDSFFYSRGLQAFGIDNPKYYYGIYSFEVLKLLLIPVTLAIGYATSLLPNLVNRTHDTITKALYNIVMIIYPITLFTYIKGDIIYNMFFNNEIGGIMLKRFSLLILLFSMNQILSSVMIGLSRGKKLILSLFIGFLIKISLTFVLLKLYGINGSYYSTSISLFIMILMNVVFLKDEFDSSYLYKFLILFISANISIIGIKFNLINPYFDFLVNVIVYFLIYIFLNIMLKFITNRLSKNN